MEKPFYNESEKANLSSVSILRVTDKLFKTQRITGIQAIKVKKVLELSGKEQAQKELESIIKQNKLSE
jgi:hypothetical protein